MLPLHLLFLAHDILATCFFFIRSIARTRQEGMKIDLQPSKGILELGKGFRGAETAVSWWSLRVKGRPKTQGHAPCIYPLPFIFGALSMSLIAGRVISLSALGHMAILRLPEAA